MRYPTAGSLSAAEAQPFFVNAPYGIYLVHNGNITNTAEQREKVTGKYSRHLRTTSDSEILLNVLADKVADAIKVNGNVEPIRNIFAGCEDDNGAGSGRLFGDLPDCRCRACWPSVTLTASVLLSVAKRETEGDGDDYAFASEDVAFGINGFDKLRDLRAGEAILIDLDGNMHEFQAVEGKLTPCIFEYVYLARPDSLLDGVSVYKTQMRMGQTLAKQIQDSGLEIDRIIPVPDSARPVALEAAKITGIPYREGLVKEPLCRPNIHHARSGRAPEIRPPQAERHSAWSSRITMFC